MAIRILSSENITGNITVSGTGTFAGDITLDDDLNFTTNGFADISNTGTGAMRFKPSSQTLALTLTNANAAFEGKVGIGTTSPARELEVQGGGNVYIRVTASTDNDSAALELKNTQEMWTIRNEDTNADALHFNSDGGTKMVIETGGNVGIGETSPNEKLHVNGGTANVVANFESTDAKAYISFKDSSTTNTDTVFLGAEGNNMTFYAGSASSERMRIDSSGNVGIGEASPDSLLTVGGDFTATTAKPTVSVSDMTNGGSLGIRGLSPILAFDKTASGVPKILMDGGGLEFKDGTLDSQGSVDLKIDSSGNVGIGKTTSLTSHRLSILKGGSNQQLGLYYDETNVAMFGARSNGDAQIYAWNGSSYRNILLGVDGSSTGGNVGIGTDSPSSGAKPPCSYEPNTMQGKPENSYNLIDTVVIRAPRSSVWTKSTRYDDVPTASTCARTNQVKKIIHHSKRQSPNDLFANLITRKGALPLKFWESCIRQRAPADHFIEVPPKHFRHFLIWPQRNCLIL